MPKQVRELSAKEVRDLKPKTITGEQAQRRGLKPERVGEPYVTYHPVGGVSGLLLRVTPTGAKSWVLRTVIGKRRRDIGLGGFPDVTLKQARENAREIKEKKKKGIDPIEERRAARAALEAQDDRRMTFAEAARQRHEIIQDEFRNEKHRRDWINSLKIHAFPAIGKKQVSEIGTDDVLRVLRPIWANRTETATRVRQRIESVLKWAVVAEKRDEGPNPAAWGDNLSMRLPKPAAVREVKHFSALHYTEAAEFMRELRKREGMGATALEFLILTAARPGEVVGATWKEIDLEARKWRRPGERMKNGKKHTVPLNDRAMAILQSMSHREGLIFANSDGAGISDGTMNATIKRMHKKRGWFDRESGERIVPHGFRSSFKDWARHCTSYDDEVSELALSHINDDKTRAAYARGGLMEKRANLLHDWQSYLDEVPTGGKVSSIARKTG